MDNSLLASIQKGKKLKHTSTNDRSAATVGGGVVENGKTKSSAPAARAAAPAESSTGPKLAGPLFAGGMPKLKPVGSMAAPSAPEPAPVAAQRPAPQVMQRPAAAQAQRPALTEPVIRRPAAAAPIESGMAKMRVSEGSRPIPAQPTAAPAFSPANLRKTGIDMTKSNGHGAAISAPAAKAPVVSRPAPAAPREPPKPAATVPSSTGIASVNGRWKFPSDSQIPPPPAKAGGVRKVYPSGRAEGLTVKPQAAPQVVVAPKQPPPPEVKRPSTVAAAPKKPTADSGSLIDQKVRQLNDDLKAAVTREEFEQCIELRGRIKRLKALKQDADDGFDISPAEINAV